MIKKGCILFFLALSFSLNAQMVVDSLGFESFEMSEEDTSYVMKKYFLVHLNEGPNRSQDSLETQKLQMGHLGHLNKMAEEGHLCIAGPSAIEHRTRGILIMYVPNMEAVEALISEDPMIKVGRLTYEILPFWAASGSSLF